MTDINDHRTDQAADTGEPPDDLAPEERAVPEEEPSPEEYEPVDPDVEAIVDGGVTGADGSDDPDAAYPRADAEQPEATTGDDVEP